MGRLLLIILDTNVVSELMRPMPDKSVEDGFTAPPTQAQQTAAARPFIRRALLNQQANAPMLVINGADDVHVVQADTLVFQGRPDTEVHLIPGTGHTAASKYTEVIPTMIEWLRARLAA
jgi:esterase FrsA